MNKHEKYAEVLIKNGVNLQQNQTLAILAPIECVEFIRIVVKKAYESGAKFVHVDYYDDELESIRLLYSQTEYLNYYPDFIIKNKIDMTLDNVALLKFNPGLLAPCSHNVAKKLTMETSRNVSMAAYTKVKREHSTNSCTAILPTTYWASQLFPDIDASEALQKLWDHVFIITQCHSEDPCLFWDNHTRAILERRDFLNTMRFKKLHIYDTHSNFTVDLVDNHLWVGGGEKKSNGSFSMPNFPTEEIFTAMAKNGVNGKVHSSKPLVFQNSIIHDFTLEFENGKVINSHAAENDALLTQLLNTDEGSRYCGEIALLSGHTLVSSTNTVYKNTLLDENAACHMALGCAYLATLKDSIPHSKSSFDQHGINFSAIHCDFMFGRVDTTVVAYDQDNQLHTLISEGQWII